MYPWRRILIPTDFSTASEWAFDDAIRLAGATGAELLILHIRMTRTSQPQELRFPADESIYAYAEQQELDALVRRHGQRVVILTTLQFHSRSRQRLAERYGASTSRAKKTLLPGRMFRAPGTKI